MAGMGNFTDISVDTSVTPPVYTRRIGTIFEDGTSYSNASEWSSMLSSAVIAWQRSSSDTGNATYSLAGTPIGSITISYNIGNNDLTVHTKTLTAGTSAIVDYRTANPITGAIYYDGGNSFEIMPGTVTFGIEYTTTDAFATLDSVLQHLGDIQYPFKPPQLYMNRGIVSSAITGRNDLVTESSSGSGAVKVVDGILVGTESSFIANTSPTKLIDAGGTNATMYSLTRKPVQGTTIRIWYYNSSLSGAVMSATAGTEQTFSTYGIYYDGNRLIKYTGSNTTSVVPVISYYTAILDRPVEARTTLTYFTDAQDMIKVNTTNATAILYPVIIRTPSNILYVRIGFTLKAALTTNTYLVAYIHRDVTGGDKAGMGSNVNVFLDDNGNGATNCYVATTSSGGDDYPYGLYVRNSFLKSHATTGIPANTNVYANVWIALTGRAEFNTNYTNTDVFNRYLYEGGCVLS